MERPRFLSVPESLAEALRLTPVRPALAAGLRAAVATVLPLGLALLLHRPELAPVGLAGFLTTLVDKGGAYRSRAEAMFAVALAGLVLSPLAALGADGVVAPLAMTFLVATLCTFARVFGGSAGTVGSVSLVLFLVALAQPMSVSAALERGLWYAAGSAWAMALALFMWPVRPYGPVRAKVAAALRQIAAYTTAVATGAGPLDEAEAAALRAHRGRIRQALEDARAALTATRRGRRGESPRGERLIVLLALADRTFAAAVTLAEEIETQRARGVPEPQARKTLADASSALGAIARVVDPPLRLRHPRPYFSTPHGEPTAQRPLEERLMALVREADELASSLEDERPVAALSPPEPGAARRLEAVTENLSLRSAIFRHALRAGVTTSLAAALAHGFALERGQWVTIAAAVTLQPQLPATWLRALQRVLGTVAGALIAASLTGLLDSPLAMLVAVFLFAVIGVSVQPVSYALYATFLTPTFVLLAESASHDPSLAATRVVNTLIGGGLALAAARFLWPVSERDLFPAASRAALRALERHFAAVAEARPEPERDRARREIGLALLNAEASIQRWLAEVRRSAATLEAPVAAVAHMRHLAAAIVALGAHAPSEAADLAAARPILDRLGVALGDLDDAVEHGAPPARLPDLADLADLDAALARLPTGLKTRLERVAESLTLLHAALSRWLA